MELNGLYRSKKMKKNLLSKAQATELGFSTDKRKRRNQHRTAALNLLRNGGFFNNCSARGTTFGDIAAWHLAQARALV